MWWEGSEQLRRSISRNFGISGIFAGVFDGDSRVKRSNGSHGARRFKGSKGIVILLALVLSMGAGLGVGALKAQPAEAQVVGGKDATELGGQVQYYVDKPEQMGDPKDYRCTGTLISPKWVLTAKHCIADRGGTTDNISIWVGDKRLGEGDPYKTKSIHLNPNTDTALLELGHAAPAEHVVGYSDSTTEVGDRIQVRGWGRVSRPGEPKKLPQTLQEANVTITDTTSTVGTPGSGNRLQASAGAGAGGITNTGDSGAGWYRDGLIHAVHSGSNKVDRIAGVPTEDIADWIKQVSGVEPTQTEDGQPKRTSPERTSERTFQQCANFSGKKAASDVSDEECKESEQDGKDKEEPDKGSKSPSRVGASGKVGAGAGAGIAADAIDNFIDGVDEAENSGEVAKGIVEVLEEQFPEHNVMLIQQETYDRDEAEKTLEGMVFGPEDKSVTIGDNNWDVWVFESGEFTNTGDLGYENWAFSGDFERTDEDDNPDDSGNTVTFESTLTEEEREEIEPELAETYLANREIYGSANEEDIKEILKDLRTRFPSYNVMLINQETYDKSEDTKNMDGVVPTDETAALGGNAWDVWLFESGTITNPGDGGYENWGFDGNYERTDEDGNPDDSGSTVTFEPIESEGSEGDQGEEEQTDPEKPLDPSKLDPIDKEEVDPVPPPDPPSFEEEDTEEDSEEQPEEQPSQKVKDEEERLRERMEDQLENPDPVGLTQEQKQLSAEELEERIEQQTEAVQTLVKSYERAKDKLDEEREDDELSAEQEELWELAATEQLLERGIALQKGVATLEALVEHLEQKQAEESEEGTEETE